MKENKKETFIKKHWKGITIAGIYILGTAFCVSKIISAKNKTDPSIKLQADENTGDFLDWLLDNFGNDIYEKYIEANFSKEELLKDPCALILIGDEAVRYNTFTNEQANDILHTFAVELD